jgi:DNA-binding HxlR family transcriptional regulator
MKPAISTSPFEFWTPGTPMVPAAPMAGCPIQTSMGFLGKKWTILILRDMAMQNAERFSELLRSIEGLTPRILSIRLKELEAEGIIMKKSVETSPSIVRWKLTDKGWDALPILMSLFAFGSKWYPQAAFADGKAREMVEIYPQRNLREQFVNLRVEDKGKE